MRIPKIIFPLTTYQDGFSPRLIGELLEAFTKMLQSLNRFNAAIGSFEVVFDHKGIPYEFPEDDLCCERGKSLGKPVKTLMCPRFEIIIRFGSTLDEEPATKSIAFKALEMRTTGVTLNQALIEHFDEHVKPGLLDAIRKENHDRTVKRRRAQIGA